MKKTKVINRRMWEMVGIGTKLRLGIIGLGQAGSQTIQSAIRHSHISITAAADINEVNLDAFKISFPDAEIYRDVLDMLQSNQVDAVYIATPTGLHKEHALLAAEYKKHILVEKPIALTLQEADDMIAAAKKNGVVLLVNHKRSYDPPIRKIRDIIKSGDLGRLRMIHNWHYSDWLYRPRTAEELRDGGVVLRQGAHHFDMIRYMGGGEIRSVKANIGIWDSKRQAEGSYTAYLDFEDGTVATSVYSGYDHFHSTHLTGGIGVQGRRTSWSTDPDLYARSRRRLKTAGGVDAERSLKSSSGFSATPINGSQLKTTESHPFFGLNIVSCEKGDIIQSPEGLMVYGDDERWEISLANNQTGLDAVIHEFYEAIVHHTVPVHSGEYGKACLEICLAVIESSKERREIMLNHQMKIPN